jgi:pimeloyl-[acyl-carrier protein] methyl ester esterase
VLNGWAASEQAWDLCAFMNSPAPNGEMPSLYSYIDQLDGRPEEAFENGGRFILVGWSMGGSSALRLACRYPEQVAGLILVAATPRMMEDREAGWRGMSPRRLEALRKGLELTHGQGFFGVPEGRPNPYMMDTPENLDAGLDYLRQTDIRADLARVFGGGEGAFPVSILQSERDGIVRPENAAFLKTQFPHARVEMVPGAEHALPVAIPEAVDGAVARMLNLAI